MLVACQFRVIVKICIYMYIEKQKCNDKKFVDNPPPPPPIQGPNDAASLIIQT